MVLGVLVSLSSVGAGALGAASLVFLYPRMPAVRIAGTDIAHAVPLTIVAGLGHAWLGTVNYSLLASLLVGSVPGIVLGSLLSGRLPERISKSLSTPNASASAVYSGSSNETATWLCAAKL